MKLFSELKLQINGSAYVSWTDINKDSHFDSITYLNSDTTLMEPSINESELVIDAGRHTFEFQFDIPENCPSSYEGFHGYIRYLVKIIFVRSFINETKEVPFTVIKPFNLNNDNINLSVSFRRK